jgi:hypothetical protein
MDTSDVKVVTNMDFAMTKERWMRDREHYHWGGTLNIELFAPI